MEIIIKPDQAELPASYADRLGLVYTKHVSFEHKKKLGQFFTPLQIANFMAAFCSVSNKKIKILDPGCGIGILSCSLIQEIVFKYDVIELELIAFETDNEILNYTDACFEYLSLWLKSKKIKFSYFLCKNDFVLHNSSILLDSTSFESQYDIIIANPPYFKIRKDDPRAIAAISIIHGQSNIYSIFMIIAAKLLKDEGQFIFITPRSFTSGSYFRVFRNNFFSLINISNIHVFDSRKKAFERDKVLQENIIVVAKKSISKNKIKLPIKFEDKDFGTLLISRSKGINDIDDFESKRFKFVELVNVDSVQKILHIPITKNDEKAIDIFKGWNCNLKTFGMNISTGPVVDFRSLEFISDCENSSTVPLIYLHNIEKMQFVWPADSKGKIKGQYIIKSKKSESRLISNSDIILLRRFSSKDDHSKLIASPYLSSWLPNYLNLGIENHLNYIYRADGKMTKDEIYGIAALLNSKLFDIYFRTFNGNINVSATELRELPLPELQVIKSIGKRIKLLKNFSQNLIDNIIQEKFKIALFENEGFN